MFDEFASDIEKAVSEVIEKYSDKIKKQKCSKNTVAYWVMDGARRALKEKFSLP